MEQTEWNVTVFVKMSFEQLLAKVSMADVELAFELITSGFVLDDLKFDFFAVMILAQRNLADSVCFCCGF